jgi:hypothetical protein
MSDELKPFDDRRRRAVFLGFVAGFILLAANLPILHQQILTSDRLTDGEIWSRTAMLVGQLAWVASGLLARHCAIIIMCSIQAVLLSLIIAIAVMN